MIYRVHEVLNYGGFFAGDTATLTAHDVSKPTEEQTFTIDQSALTNVGGDRFKIVAGMALELVFEGEHVAAATVVAAKERETLRDAVVIEPAVLAAPRLFSYFCKACGLWILGEPKDDKCGIEGHVLS